MKKAQAKDFFREIRRSLNRYLSILLIVAMGVAFYSGVRSAQPDMKLSADTYYDNLNFMDMRVMGELGITKDDIDCIAGIDGVTQAQGGYNANAMISENGANKVVSIQSLGQGMNAPELQNGRMPQSADECFVDQAYMDAAGLEIGDTLTVFPGDSEDDILDTLSVETFTVVGSGSYGWYLSFDRGTANIGNGDVSFFMLVPPEAFSLDVYTVAYIACDDLDAMNSFDDDYKDEIARITDEIESIADARCEIRFEDVKNEGAEKLADANKEIADGEWELDDAALQLADAQVKLADAQQDIEDGEKELADGEKELADAKSEIRKHEKEIADGWIEIEDAKQKLADAAQEIADGRFEISGGKAAISNSRAQLGDQAEQFDQFANQAQTLKTQQGYQDAQSNYANLKGAQEAGLPLDEQQQAALGFYGQILPGMEQALGGATDPGDDVLGATVDGVLQPTRDAIDDGYSQLRSASNKIERAEEQLDEGEQEYLDGMAEIAENEQKLLDGEKEIADAKKKIRDAEKELEEGRVELEDGKQKLLDAQVELDDAQTEYDEKSADARSDIADAKQKVADAQSDLDELELPEWYVLDRESIQSYVEYSMDAERIGAVGQVFPAIFFLVAALVSLTTMTRMVEEERQQIGTMKALGYSQASIASKYLGYALSASLIGGVLGIAVGSNLLPYVIMTAYNIMYCNLSVMLTPIQWDISLWAMIIAVLCTVVATYGACYVEFRATPASLMRPVAPAQGKRVILERIPGLWKRMSFSQKATFRNLFRYKKRFFMTVFGIGACMGLLLVGFGVRNSIAEIVNKQYTTVWAYDARVSFDEDDQAMMPDLLEDLGALDVVNALLPVRENSMDVRANGVTKSAYLFAPKDISQLDDFVNLRDRKTQQQFVLGDEGVILTEKIARLLSVKAGDKVELMEDETTSVEVEVTAVVENYLQHYVYITPALYEKLYGVQPEYNTIFMQTDYIALEDEDSMGETFLNVEHVTAVAFTSDLQSYVADMMTSLDMVIWVLVIAAGLLAFIVLYNLNNISIIERRRELATLKVLGFHDGEVAAYVYRENVWLTLFGIIAGLGIGVVLHKFVIRTCEVDMLMFGQNIYFESFVYSILLTCIFAVIVNLFMFFKLRKIDMVESLKSVE